MLQGPVVVEGDLGADERDYEEVEEKAVKPVDSSFQGDIVCERLLEHHFFRLDLH